MQTPSLRCIPAVGILLWVVFAALSSQQRDLETQNASLDWKYEHLRWIDPIDSVSIDSEILAVYYKGNPGQSILRIDLLEVEQEPKITLHIHILSPADRNGVELAIYPEQISFRSAGQDIPSDHPVRIVRNTAQNSVEIYFPSALISPLGLGVQIKVTTLSLNDGLLLDQAGPISPYSTPPKAVRMGFIFENILQAATPAQALRSWDGAHSGPDSQRHGLRNLLRATEIWQVPVCLPGLRSPETKRLFDFLGVESETSSYAYMIDCNYDYAHLSEKIFSRIEPDPKEGFSSQTIQEILELNFQTPSSHNPPLLIRADLAQSKWGVFEAGVKAFEYIRQHPWLQPLNLHDYPVRSDFAASLPVDDLPDEIALAYLRTPENAVKHMACEMVSYLIEPDDTKSMALKSIYLSQVGHLLAAAEWAEQPQSISRCDQDIDWDGQSECILANENLFLTIEPQHASITIMFALTDQGPQQIVAPTWQFHTGLSDPSQWNLTTSDPQAADPGQMPGANFFENSDFSFTPLPSRDSIELPSIDMAMRSTISVHQSTLRITYHAVNPATISYSFLLDPWHSSTCQFCDFATLLPFDPIENTWGWNMTFYGQKSSSTVLISANNPLQVDTFMDSRPFLSTSENPNYDYPRGHYLPIPFAFFQVRVPAGTSTTEISISTAPQLESP